MSVKITCDVEEDILFGKALMWTKCGNKEKKSNDRERKWGSGE